MRSFVLQIFLCSHEYPKSVVELKLRPQNQLDAIDGRRKDGVFGGDLSHVPEGQAACMDVMEFCYSLVHELLVRPIPLNPQSARASRMLG